MVETLETSHTWTHLHDLRRRSATRSATRSRARARPGSSSAISPTPIRTAPRSTSPSSPAPGGRGDRAVAGGQAGGLEAIVAAGGTITHHHAVGRDHAPYMEAEVGARASTSLRAVKERARPGRDHEPRQAAPGRASPLFAGFDDRAGDRAFEDRGAAVAREPSSLPRLRQRRCAVRRWGRARLPSCRSRRRAGRAPGGRSGSGRRSTPDLVAWVAISGSRSFERADQRRPCRTGPAAPARRPFALSRRTTFWPGARTAPGPWRRCRRPA